ncbi:hypothetical protein CLV56_2459 [Mumia flava]|uniref:Uncharacterized protein n=1 Tax=Mumia flava TaxID=1348852 RepID=A0A0B2BUI7_9ACTN|nr:hypothetical protein [Mumia flava]PJJ58213.1 hypothetical protein CLV56_2459 [Mumia flava]
MTSRSTSWRRPRTVAVAAVFALVLAVVIALRTGDDVVADEPQPDGSVERTNELPTERPDEIGAPRDPLSIEEIGYAKHLAETDASMPDDATDVDGDPVAQLLSVDLTPTEGETTQRLVDVTFYDYTDNHVITQTVDLGAGTVDSADGRGFQPPPSPAETSAALAVVLADPISDQLQAESLKGTGATFDAESVSVTGSAWTAGPDQQGPAARCGKQRCVELRIQLPDGLYLTASGLVVNLSQGTVLDTTGDHGDAGHDHADGDAGHDHSDHEH